MIQKIKFFNNDLVFALNKPILLTSNQVIQLIKKYSSFDKIGHSGTLDPSASGVLVVCTNKKTKFLNFIFDKNKRYLVFFIIGVESDSLDIFGKVKYFCLDKIKIEKKIAKFFISSVKRNYIQTPPGYSSIKHHGYSLYKYSRLEIKLHLKLML
ncbi:MAG TPA: pseudouridine synthase family protein [Candidatus Azoamicus sp.]